MEHDVLCCVISAENFQEQEIIGTGCPVFSDLIFQMGTGIRSLSSFSLAKVKYHMIDHLDQLPVDLCLLY